MTLANNLRYDLSDHLIHFFRQLDIEAADAPPLPEAFDQASILEDTVIYPEFLLRHAIRMGRLWATWSERSGRRTIYGPRPAVCFTEMPIPAFVEASLDRRARGEAMSSYALVFPKAAIHRAGGRPVIYGLSSGASASLDADGVRMFPQWALPEPEQYRFVAYDPTQPRLDWTHEREWRWPLDGPPLATDGMSPPEAAEMPGLDFESPIFRGMGVIVATAEQARRIVFDILTKIDRGDVGPSHFSFVLPIQEVGSWVDLRDRGALATEIDARLVVLNEFFVGDETEDRAMLAALEARAVRIEATTPPDGSGLREHGACWLWLRDNRHPVTRALVRAGLVHVNRDGRYLVALPQFDGGRPLSQRERMVERLAAELTDGEGPRADRYSVSNGYGPDDIPSHMTGEFDDLFFNVNVCDEAGPGGPDRRRREQP